MYFPSLEKARAVRVFLKWKYIIDFLLTPNNNILLAEIFQYPKIIIEREYVRIMNFQEKKEVILQIILTPDGNSLPKASIEPLLFI